MPSVTLVTGAAGFAGGHLLDLLAADAPSGVSAANPSNAASAAGETGGAGAARIIAWHRPGGAPPRDVPGTIWEAVELLDRAAVRDAIARLRPSLVYHCAGAAHVGRAWDRTESTLAINVRATHHLLDALAAARVDARVLIPSSAMVYAAADRALAEDDPLVPSSPYGLSKLAQELLGCRANGTVRVSVARAFNHIGPRQAPMFAASGFARRIADIERGRWAPEISAGNLDAQRDLTDVRDTVRAYRQIAERGEPGRVYNVCTGRAIVIRDLLNMMIARARVPVTVTIDPARYRPNDVPLLLGDPARIHRELGWTPEISLDRTIDDLLHYWRTEPPVTS
jgi:GDP-4-dehydro-6-deoxy-D-mannose reductase